MCVRGRASRAGLPGCNLTRAPVLQVLRVLQLQYEAEDAAGGAAAVQLRGTAVEAQYRIVPDARAVRLSARRRPRRQHGSTAAQDRPDLATIQVRDNWGKEALPPDKQQNGMKAQLCCSQIHNTGCASLDLSVANFAEFDLGTRAAGAAGVPGGNDEEGASTAEPPVAPKLSRAMTSSEQAAVQRCDGLPPLAARCFHVVPEPGRVVSLPPGAQLALGVRFSPPAFSKQYVAVLELRLGGGSNACTVRRFTCFGNFSPGQEQQPGTLDPTGSCCTLRK